MKNIINTVLFLIAMTTSQFCVALEFGSIERELSTFNAAPGTLVLSRERYQLSQSVHDNESLTENQKTELRNQFIETINNKTNLKRLNFNAKISCTNEIIEEIVNCHPHLTHLEIKNCQDMTDIGFSRLSAFTRLQFLILNAINGITEDHIIEIINNNPDLKHLEIQDDTILDLLRKSY